MSERGSGARAGGRLRIGVLGAAGQLGRCLLRSIYASEDLELVFGATRESLDVNASEAIGEFLDAYAEAPADFVINAAAFTKVDACESQKELAYQTNALAPADWARELANRGIGFVHLSTDYVFPGDGSIPYAEDDPTEPRTVYGSSKRAGEIAVLGTHAQALVVRTSWVFGPGRNFVVAILDQAARRRRGETSDPLRVVDDQQGSPTYAADLAEALLARVRLAAPGQDGRSRILHLRNSGETTWYGFARAILDQTGYADLEIEAVPTSAFETAARRPAYSVLDCGRAAAMGIELRPWTQALAGYLAGPDGPRSLYSDTVRAGSASSPDRTGGDSTGPEESEVAISGSPSAKTATAAKEVSG